MIGIQTFEANPVISRLIYDVTGITISTIDNFFIWPMQVSLKRGLFSAFSFHCIYLITRVWTPQPNIRFVIYTDRLLWFHAFQN